MNLSAWTSRTETPGIVAEGGIWSRVGSRWKFDNVNFEVELFESAAAWTGRSDVDARTSRDHHASPSTFAIGSIRDSVC